MKARIAPITPSGRVTIPAEIRRRWGTRDVVLFDHGDSIMIWPSSGDPIHDARGSMTGSGPSADEIKRMLREQDRAIEERRLRT
jgi:bifunctional DNA-binding transcriptional regulator/antitoxin component of YhaV-PrlF toxin-antitoxin module